MPRAKTQTLKKTTKKVEEPKQQTINIDDLVSHIREQVKKELTAEFEGKMQTALANLSQNAEISREKLILTASKTPYTVEANDDGLEFLKDTDTVLVVGKNGQLSTGTKSARTVGKGSAHFKAGYSSEAIMPTSGDLSTRGVIVEGDGDDDKTFIFRAVSRMNRQGANIFSDGSLALGAMKKRNGETLSVYHRHDDGDAVNINIPSLAYEGSLLHFQADRAQSKRWNALKISADAGDTTLYKVDGNGDTYTAGTLYSNNTGYAEVFEWADGNHRNEDRSGFTVTMDKTTGLIRSADEGDDILGVVVTGAAFVGGSQWNCWKDRNLKDEAGNTKTSTYEIVEWLEMESTSVKSYYKDTLSKDFALPDNAVIIETDELGKEFKKPMINPGWDSNKEYVGRQDRQEWALVCLLGTIPVFKGQVLSSNWIRLRDLTDELELVLIK